MDQRLTQQQLAERLEQAALQVKIGRQYMHYKDMPYKVIMLAVREEDNEPCVIYQAEYGKNITFIRTVANWTEQVIVDGKKVARFTLIDTALNNKIY